MWLKLLVNGSMVAEHELQHTLNTAERMVSTHVEVC